jgi:DNA polymerase-3 subunit chi
MTEVRFYVNLPDRLGYACRLLRKAHSLGTPVVVTGEAADLQALDQALWTFSAQDFVPHAMVGSTPPEVMTRTPIVFAPDPLAAAPRGLLVNLGTSVPEGYDQFERLFELIGTEPGAVQAGRDRWRHYSQQGFSVQKHDPQAA